MQRRFALFSLTAGFTLAACSDAPAQLIVVIHSDYAVPSELSNIEVSVSSNDGAPVTHSFDLASTPLPLSFGVLPPGGDPSRPISIEVRGGGAAADKAPAVRRRLARFPEVTSRLGVFLARSCEGVACQGEQTCTEDGCASDLVDAAVLVPVVPGAELEGLCIPGAERCTPDRRGLIHCPRWGEPEETMSCPGRQLCVAAVSRCVGDNPVDFKLDLSLGGDAEGRVQSTPAGIDCGMGEDKCDARFLENTSVRLSVVEATGTFSGWGGACVGPGECVLQMDGDKQVSASFARQESFTLSVSSSGSGGGTINSDPVGIDCGPVCQADFPPATLVTLTVLPDPDSTFLGWTGACSGSGDCVVTMSSALVVGAEFVPRSGPQTLTVVPTGGGVGNVDSSPAGIDCGATCMAEFPFDSRVELAATPMPGSVFSGWRSPDCGGNTDCILRMDRPHRVEAEFVPDSGVLHRVSLIKQGNADGSVQSSDGALVCNTGCAATGTDLLQGSTIRLQATPDVGAAFDGWSGDCAFAAMAPECVLSIDGPKNVTASFSSVPVYPIQITVNGGGRVTGPGIDCPGDCAESFPAGALVPLTALAPVGRIFAGFQGGGCAQYSPCTVTVNAPGGTVGAVFSAYSSVTHDFNDDGLVDLLFAAPDYDVQGSGPVLLNAGRVYITFGGIAGPSVPPRLADGADRRYSGTMSGAEFGASLAAVGDMTGDGYSDFAIGAPGENGGSGIIRLVPGGPALPPSGPANTLPSPPGAAIIGTGGMRLGASLAVVPDLDFDGRPELLAGAPGVDATALGSAHLFLSSTLGTGGGVGVDAVRFPGAGGGFGSQVASIGDYNDDGEIDLAVSAPFHGGQGQGQVSIYLGPFAIGPDRQPSFTISGALPAQNAGVSVIGVGHFNDDDFSDLALGSRNTNTVFVFFGNRDMLGVSLTTADADLTLAGGGGFFGTALASGDVTEDGFDDLLVGAPNSLGPGRGEVTIFAGGRAPSATPWGSIVGNCSLLGNCAAEGLGRTVTVWGDLNRDGVADVVLGSDYGGGTAGSPGRGRITAFYGGTGLSGSTSSGAPIQIMGEDQLNGHCSALPASSSP